ncbi:hypothetical protein V6N13_014174 [Hibiscus sabdariffa]|uniref:Bifunctional inhibitor/plant lipid transfer protein/seed storage helical domain-containing protein n=1 Tax=Hibiscus sabdariffa TaxID=183260 RepID=A0ABR2RUN5_9ROSI
MCASLKFLAMLIFLIASGLTQVSIVSANGDFSGSRGYMPPFSESEVEWSLAPCRPFLGGTRPDPTPACCEGIGDVVGLTKTKRDEQELCVCLKKVIPLGDPKRLPLLGDKCSTKIAPIDGGTDCSKWQR